MSIAPDTPRVQSRFNPMWLAVAAAANIALWLVFEQTLQRPIHPQFAEMLMAARSMQAASRVLFLEKEMRGLTPPMQIDPNRTGMIGQEYTPITTTIGELPAKRTATNPDFAAALVHQIASLGLPRGAPVVIVVSGSFVGGDIAAITATETLGLRPIVIASLSASMWGANEPELNLIDMLAALRERNVIRTRAIAAVLGGGGAIGGSMDPDGVAALRRSAARDGVPIVDARPVSALIDALLARINAATGEARPGAVINVGGALIGLGSCRESYEWPPGLTRRAPTCSDGTQGLAMRLGADGLPVLHIINMRRLALEWGLPFDPIPLPIPGNNRAIYGTAKEPAKAAP
jgi:poly-gamma-glutamate system protein